MNKFFTCIIVLFTFFHSIGQKKSLSPELLEQWERLSSEKISNNGKWVSYQIQPYIGDTKLHVINEDDSLSYKVDRASKAIISSNSDWVAFHLKMNSDSLRTLNINKTKKNKLPKDTLGILVLDKDTILKYPKIKSFQTSKESSSWIAFTVEKDKKKKKEQPSKKKKRKKKKKKNSTPPIKKQKRKIYKTSSLIILNPITAKEHRFQDVSSYAVSYNGNTITFITHSGDSIQQSGVYSFNTQSEKIDTLYSGEGIAKKPTINRLGSHVAFVLSQDTGKTKIYNLYLSEDSQSAQQIVDTTHTNLPQGWSVSEYSRIRFSKDGKFLWFGTAPKPVEATKDSLASYEKANVDIWGYKDLSIMPQQLKNLKREKNKTYAAVFQIKNRTFKQLADEDVDRVSWINFGKSNFAIGTNRKPYQIANTWEYPWGRDVYLVDVLNGSKKLVLKDQRFPYSISNDGRFVLYYNSDQKDWYSIDLQKQDTVNLTSSLSKKGHVFFDEEQQTPSKPYPFGLAGWTQNNSYILIYSKYDIWKVDPTGAKQPVSITKSYATENKVKFRYIKTDPEQEFIRLDLPIILKAQNQTTNIQSYYIRYKNAERFLKLEEGEVFYSRLRKARDADRYIFRKEDYYHEPNLYYLVDGNLNLEDRFKNNLQLTNYNTQKVEYNWGNVQQYHWTDESGEKRKGLLFLPDHIEQGDSIPMLVYYYEKYFSSQFKHRAFRPSYSTISVPLYTSNGYAVFIPDITYGTGHPGKDANKAVLSGVKALLQSHPFINKHKIGLQGQSWGGYQTAILVTQTDLFRAAMAGAPVSNMTSAYGGVRWGSGLSRMFQYEQTQSRIGAKLWDAQELYIENSPLFHVPNIKTPLLIMHNDKDGAVPWYQGIEMYMAMRRLNKPCWMLNYNGEEHNLTKLPNRLDLSKRMFQFFNHYLKDKPAPSWMKNGRKAIDKSTDNGFSIE